MAEEGISVENIDVVTNDSATATTGKHHKIADLSKTDIQENNDEQETARVSLPIAEDIARVRGILEQKIVMEGLPANEWQRVYEEIIPQFPSIKNYKDLMNNVVSAAEEQNKNLGNFWEQYQPIEQGENTGMAKQASSEAAQEMFKSIFGFEPQGDVEIFKGPITLRVMLNEQDFKNTALTDENTTEQALEHGKGFSEFKSKFGFSIMVFRSKNELTNEGLFHEFEHSKNNLLNRVKASTLLNHPEELNMPLDIVARLTRRAKETPIEMGVKDELLASFAPAAFLELVPPDERMAFLQDIERFPKDITSILTLREGQYYSQYTNGRIPQEGEYSSYVKQVTKGAEAMVDLFRIYLNEKKEPSAGRMTINILEQFPLRSWPAVVMLIQARHSKSNAQN